MITAMILCTLLYILAALAGVFTTAVLIFTYQVATWRVFDESGEML
jgi:hypothetical protein